MPRLPTSPLLVCAGPPVMALSPVAREPLGPSQISAGFLCSPCLQAPGPPGAGEGSATLAGADPFLPATLAVHKTQPRLLTSNREMLGADAWSAGAPGPLLFHPDAVPEADRHGLAQVANRTAGRRTRKLPLGPLPPCSNHSAPPQQDSKLRAPRPRPQHCRARSVARLGERAASPEPVLTWGPSGVF